MLVRIYNYAMTSSLRTKLVEGQWRTCKSLVPADRVNQSSFTNTCWRYSLKVRILGVKERANWQSAVSDSENWLGERVTGIRTQPIGTLRPLQLCENA